MIDITLIGATIIFVALKLMGIITWSWWIVFSPLLFLVVVFLLITAFALFFPDYFEALYIRGKKK